MNFLVKRRVFKNPFFLIRNTWELWSETAIHTDVFLKEGFSLFFRLVFVYVYKSFNILQSYDLSRLPFTRLLPLRLQLWKMLNDAQTSTMAIERINTNFHGILSWHEKKIANLFEISHRVFPIILFYYELWSIFCAQNSQKNYKIFKIVTAGFALYFYK